MTNNDDGDERGGADISGLRRMLDWTGWFPIGISLDGAERLRLPRSNGFLNRSG